MHQIVHPPNTAAQSISLYTLYAAVLCHGLFNTPPSLSATQRRAVICHHPCSMHGFLSPDALSCCDAAQLVNPPHAAVVYLLVCQPHNSPRTQCINSSASPHHHVSYHSLNPHRLHVSASPPSPCHYVSLSTLHTSPQCISLLGPADA